MKLTHGNSSPILSEISERCRNSMNNRGTLYGLKDYIFLRELVYEADYKASNDRKMDE
jgi:hypothetical protein